MFRQRVDDHALQRFEHGVLVLVGVDSLGTERGVMVSQLVAVRLVLRQPGYDGLLAVGRVDLQSLLHLLRTGRIVEQMVVLAGDRVGRTQGLSLQDGLVGNIEEEHSGRDHHSNTLYDTPK